MSKLSVGLKHPKHLKEVKLFFHKTNTKGIASNTLLTEFFYFELLVLQAFEDKDHLNTYFNYL